MKAEVSPPPLPPPLPGLPPVAARRTPVGAIIGLSFGGILFLFINGVLAVVLVALHQGFMGPDGMVGYVIGNVLLRTAVILGILACWKSNRQAYKLLRWFFWIMVGMFAVNLVVLVPMAVAQNGR